MRIVLVQTLSEFISEAPPPAVARLSLTTDGRRCSRLDLQAMTRAGLVWLSDTYDQTAPPEVHALMTDARNLVAGWLRWQGYEVRPGRWATPRSVGPESGRFECFAWEETPGGVWRLSAE